MYHIILREENLQGKCNHKHSRQNILCYLISVNSVVVGFHVVLLHHYLVAIQYKRFRKNDLVCPLIVSHLVICMCINWNMFRYFKTVVVILKLTSSLKLCQNIKNVIQWEVGQLSTTKYFWVIEFIGFWIKKKRKYNKTLKIFSSKNRSFYNLQKVSKSTVLNTMAVYL